MKCDHQLPLLRRIQVCDLFVLSQPDVVNRFCVTGKNKINKKKKTNSEYLCHFLFFLRKMKETEAKCIPLTHIHDCFLSWLCTGKIYTPNTHTWLLSFLAAYRQNVARSIQFYWSKSPLFVKWCWQSCRCLPHVIKMSTNTYIWVRSILIKNLELYT